MSWRKRKMSEETNLTYEDLRFPNYVNTREVFAGLDVSDLAKAAVLAGLNLTLVGDAERGKTQLAKDIYRHFFGGDFSRNGQGVFVRANQETDVHNEIFSQLNIEQGTRESTKALEALVFFVDELNRLHPIGQNQFFGMGDGAMDFKGKEIELGRERYHLLLTTANIGNGEFEGTFGIDKAMLSRLHVVLDLDHNEMKTTYSDRRKLRDRVADPNIKSAPLRDLSGKILNSFHEIEKMTESSDLETLAVMDFLAEGLDNCQRYSGEGKDRRWPMACQDCPFNKEKERPLCARIKSPGQRTMQAVRKYAAALEYLAKLKNPEIKIERHELIFEAFGIVGAYKQLLNPSELRENYGHNPAVMARVLGKLREDYASVRDYILGSLEMAQRGEVVTQFYQREGRIGSYDRLNPEAKKEVGLIEPYNDARPVGLSWVREFLEAKKREEESK
jgi:hypothetical protein